MQDFFKRLLDADRVESESEEKPKELKMTSGFLPSDVNYDPQFRMTKRLKALFPSAPDLPGLPGGRRNDRDN